MTAPVAALPRIARVQILWSENGTVPLRSFASLAAADAALAAAFAKEPPPEGGAYNKTAFVVVWTDGARHEGRADVRRIDVQTAPRGGGILRQHLAIVGQRWREYHPTTNEDERAWGEELLRRLDREPKLGGRRNLLYIPEEQLLPIGTTSEHQGVSLLPDPRTAVAELEAHFAAIRSPVPVWMGHGRTVPRTTNRDVRYAANWISLALASDMSRLRALIGKPQGAIWDRWARTVEHVRRQLDDDPDLTYRDSVRFWNEQLPALATHIDQVLHGAGSRARNAVTSGGKRVQWRIRYKGPRGGEYVTHHLAPDYVTALQVAAHSLGFWPAVQSVSWLDGDTWRAS